MTRDAAGDISIDDVKRMHAACKGGTWCDCQHKLQSVMRKIVRTK